MLLTFFTDYADETTAKSVRDLGSIATRYLKGDFFMDVLPLIPLAHFGIGASPQHWYIIKVLRLLTASKVVDTRTIYTKIQGYHMDHLHRIAETDPILAEDQVLNQNKIDQMINVGFLIKIIKLVLVIGNITYFFGFFWYIFCDLSRDVQITWLESDIVHQQEIAVSSFQ